MPNELRHTINRYTLAHASLGGLARTPVPGLVLVRNAAKTELEHAIVQPLLCVVLQGCKQVSLNGRLHYYAAGDSMLISSSTATTSRIVTANAKTPYLSLALDLDIALITELVLLGSDAQVTPEEHAQANEQLMHALLRLIQALDQPHTLAALQSALLREIHHWLLLGPRADEVRQLGLPHSHARRIAQTVALLRTHYRQPLSIARLAAEAGMGRSAFHHHFRAATSLSPLQFQKQLKLIEARRLIQTQGISASKAAFDVGYESSSQFSREYARLFGLPPGKDRLAVAKALTP